MCDIFFLCNISAQYFLVLQILQHKPKFTLVQLTFYSVRNVEVMGLHRIRKSQRISKINCHLLLKQTIHVFTLHNTNSLEIYTAQSDQW